MRTADGRPYGIIAFVGARNARPWVAIYTIFLQNLITLACTVRFCAVNEKDYSAEVAFSGLET